MVPVNSSAKMNNALTLEYQDALVHVKRNGIECDAMVAPSPDCDIVRLALKLGAPPAAAILGSSYFQRIATHDPVIHRMMKTFDVLCDGTMIWRLNPKCMSRIEYRSSVSIYATCIVIATKVTGPRNPTLLMKMLERVGSKLTRELILDLEVECIQKLGWRLMPIRTSPPASKKRMRETSATVLNQ